MLAIKSRYFRLNKWTIISTCLAKVTVVFNLNLVEPGNLAYINEVQQSILILNYLQHKVFAKLRQPVFSCSVAVVPCSSMEVDEVLSSSKYAHIHTTVLFSKLLAHSSYRFQSTING